MRLIEKYLYGGVTATFVPMGIASVAALSNTLRTEGSAKEKESKSLLEGQAPKLGDLAGKVLPNEVGIVLQGIMRAADLEDSPELLGLSAAQKYALMLREYINEVSLALKHKEDLEEAKKNIISKSATGEIALTNEGYVFVRRDGEIDLIPYTKFNPKTDTPITNAELVNLRANDPRFAGNDKVMNSLLEATSMKEIRDIISQSTQRLQETSTSNEYFLNPFSQQNDVINLLKDINITQEDLKTMDLGTLIKKKVIDKGNAQALSHAVKSVLMQLTPQQRALLAIRAKEFGEEADPRVLVMEYMASMASGDHSESLDIVNTFSSGNSELRAKSAEERQIRKEQRAVKQKESGGDPFEKKKTSGAERFFTGMAEKETVEITNGAKGKFTVRATVGTITKNGDGVGLTTLENVATSDYAGGLDWKNITIGDIKVEAYKRGHILVDGGSLAKGALPVDKAALMHDEIKPDIDACRRMDEAWAELKTRGIDLNTVEQFTNNPEQLKLIILIINLVFLNHLLPIQFIGIGVNGMPVANLTDYREFVMLKAYADGDVVPNGAWEQTLLPVPEEGKQSLINSYRENIKGGKYTPQSTYKWYDPRGFFGNTAALYKGTIFIPAKKNINAVIETTGASYLPTTPEALEIERRQALTDKIQGYTQSNITEEADY